MKKIKKAKKKPKKFQGFCVVCGTEEALRGEKFGVRCAERGF